MEQRHITLITCGSFESEILAGLILNVGKEFHFPVMVREMHCDLSEFFHPARRQYDGNQLLKVVHSMQIDESVKRIALFSVDLFIPILTYIFGQAMLGGTSAIASQYRLGNEKYGLPADETLLQDRFIKEVIHELGHTFGLLHCTTPGCVMRSSTYVEDIDQKEHRFCNRCAELMAAGPRP